MWEAFEHAAFYELDNLIAILDVNRLGQTGETMHGWDLDSYARRAEAFGWHAIQIDGHDLDAIDRAYEEALGVAGKPSVIVARTIKGKGVRGRESPREAREGARRPRGRDQGAGRRAVAHRPGPKARGNGRAAPVRDGRARAPRYELGGKEVATRKAYGDALRALGGGDPLVVALDGEVSNSTHSEEFPRGAPGALPRDVHRGAADGRRRRRPAGPRLEAVRLDVRRLLLPRLRLHPHGGDQPGRHGAFRLPRGRLDR